MPQHPARRRVFPPGTETEELRFTVTKDEAERLRSITRAHDVPLSELVVTSALSPRRPMTVREKGELFAEIVGARADLGRAKMVLDAAVKEGVMHVDRADRVLEQLRQMNARLRVATEHLT